MVDEPITIVVDDSEVEATAAKLEEALGKKEQVNQVQAEADDTSRNVSLLNDQRGEIHGTNLLVRRTIAQIPGIREAYHIISLMRTMLRVSPEIGLILLAWMAGRSFLDWLAGGAREAAEYKKDIMAARGFTTRAQVNAWLAEDKRRTEESYRSSIPP